MKRKRSQYQKNWVAATRALKASHSRVSTTNDSDESDSTSVYDTFPGGYPESDVGQNNAINQLQPETRFASFQKFISFFVASALLNCKFPSHSFFLLC